jgi:hypothetical protein
MQSINILGSSRSQQTRIVAYWIFTSLVAFELVASATWALVGTEYVATTLKHLGYPLYLQSILGVWDFLAAVTVLVPRFKRLKEWAYAGAFFKFSGAVASHVITGDGPERWVAPLVFAILTLTSWQLRPPERRMTPAEQGSETRRSEWAISILILIVLAIIARFSVPK